MEEDNFRALVDTMKSLKTEDSSGKLGDTIVTLLSTFRKHFTFDQAKLVEEEFGEYEKKRLEKIPEKPPELQLKEPVFDLPPEKQKHEWF